ncbi:MAG: dihydrodipicolinate synthase family protein [Prevotella sp.]|jgi:N-acetylneuraminate lyase|nr:dihydrodipicolinate synthase family protein [Prevotella sp.]
MRDYQQLRGLVAAAFTPMDEAGNVNLPVIDSYAEYLTKTGITGVFICGTTGESASLTTGERKDIAIAWVNAVKEKMKVIVHVGSNSYPQAMELARHANEIGADGISAIAPSFFKPEKVSDLIGFFEPIAKSAEELPFYYYNMPSMTGVNLSVPLFLAEGKKRIPNLAGVKYTHNNLMEMAECLRLEDGRFEVLHGYDEILITGLALGAVAGIGSTYNYISEIYLGIIDAFEKGDMDTARKLQMKSIEIVKIFNKYGGGVRGGKAIMNLLNIKCGPCRLPFAPFSKEEYEQLKADLEKVGFFNVKK